MSGLLVAPTNVAAEWSCLGHMLTSPDVIGEVVGVPLAQEDFSQPDTRLVFQTVVERNFAGKSVDPLVVGELCRDELSQYWNADGAHIGGLLERRAREGAVVGSVLDHASIVKQLSTKRQLQDVCYHTLTAINDGKLTPEEIGDKLSTEALQITAGGFRRSELLSWMDTGREYVRQLQRVIAARQQGVEIGVYTGLPFVDNYTTGIAPGELCFIAGDPGSGKTALAWASALGFAERQAAQMPPPGKQRVHTLILSMEMNLYGSTMRVIQSLTGIDGVRLREGSLTRPEYQNILTTWRDKENLPLKFNFASNFRLSQMRALIAEGIRKFNVGFVIIDHFRQLDTDRRYTNPNQEDEAKVRFLKENVAKDLNVAVMCLAHTIKLGRDGGKPRMSDLRGSGMISAAADQIGLLWSPYKYASEDARREMLLGPEDMEIVWDKNRWGAPATAGYRFNAEKMRVQAR